MAIVIKEINVKTTVERAPNSGGIGAKEIERIKKEVLRELKETIRQEAGRNKER